ncbi:hypothetical protein M9Y10_028808 [Tritrichomonas musculus]|uniref:Protein kinase domain-containing protein n=1 Tax=Tritrichomonas musculus TaxID=1915356 RepID=A0ABR2KKD1_9EUKA
MLAEVLANDLFVFLESQTQDTLNLGDDFFSNNSNIILIHLPDKEGDFIIICTNNVYKVSQLELNNYFQNMTINNTKNIKINNTKNKEKECHIFFTSIEAKTKFKSISSNKIQSIFEQDQKDIYFFKEEINEFRKKYKAQTSINQNDPIYIAKIGYVIQRSFFETRQKRNKRDIKIQSKVTNNFKEEDFIVIREINNYTKIVFNKKDNLLYVLKKFDNSELHEIKYFEREKICNEKLIIQHPFRPIYYGYFEKEPNKSGNASNISEPVKFLVFEYIEKMHNFNFVHSKLSEKICFILEAMISIEEIHLNDFTHRDIKLLNFIVDTNKNLVLTDRKYSKSLTFSEKEDLTCDLGSNYFASPEQSGEIFYTNKTDIYSIGKLIYYMLIEINNNKSPNKKPLPKEYRLFTPIYDKCTEDNPVNRPNITKLINMFYKQVFKYYKSTLFYEKEEIEHMEKALKAIFEIRLKEIEVYLQNESKEYKLKHINEIFEIFEYLTYFNHKTQKETLKETLSKLLEIIKDGECSLSAETLNFLGKLYNEGKYLQHDPDKSIEYFKRSSKNGCSEAQYNLGKINFLKRDIKKAIEYFSESAKNNNAKAQYHLANIYKERTDDPKNEQKWIEYFTQSAKQNHSKSRIELVKYFISKQDIIGKLQQKYDDEYLTNIYKQFKFEYLSDLKMIEYFADMKKIESKIKEMKPFSMIDIIYYANDKTFVIICSYKHCYLIETNKTPDKIIKFIEDLELFYDIKFYTTNDKYSKFFDNENKFEEINTETTQLFKYFQDKHSIIYDFYFDNIEEYFINLTMKAIIGFTLRKFYFHSNEFEDKELFSLTNEKRREFGMDEFVNLRRLGQGSFSVVSLCYHLKTCRLYAIKEYLNPNEFDKYFQREKEFFENSNNEFIVKYYGNISERNAFVIEYMSHGSLTSEYVSSITSTQRMKLIVSILTGIKYLHSINFYHRDLKPMNIFINHDEEYFVGDFSCAKFKNPDNNNNMNSTRDIGSYIYTCSDTTFSSEEKDMYSIGKIIEEIIFNQKTKMIFTEFSIYENDLTDFIYHCTHKDQSNEYIIIMIFYLFEMFVIKEDSEFNNNFFKSYRSLFEHFIPSNLIKSKIKKRSDIQMIIKYFKLLLDQVTEEERSASTKNRMLKYIYLILGDAYYSGKFIPKDVTKSICYFEILGKLNNSNALYNLGIIYYKDESAPRDILKSIDYFEKSADQNNSEAQYNLGVIYLEGTGIEQDIHKAIDYFTFSANNNNVSAQYNLGTIYYEGILVKQDINEAIHYLSMAAYNYFSEAKYNLGIIYIDRDISKSIHYLTLSSKQKCSNAQFLLGMLFYEGQFVKRDINKAIHYLTLSSSQNKSSAQYLLGVIYYEGIYISRDMNKSIHYLTLAANQNDSKAQFLLGIIYYGKVYILPDINKAIHYLTLAANQNDPRAQFFLGKIYCEGIYISRDINKSIHYLSLAANQNLPIAQYYLGAIYYEDKYISRDINKAIHYLTLAANQNEPKAQYLLGVIYCEGIYISRDINKSIHYLSLAENQNLPIAQYYLGAIYYEDKYISRDINKAIHYLTLAANQNEPKAQYLLGMIYYKGKFISRDINKAIHYTTLAANQNDPKAQFFLGMIYCEGIYISRDINKSIHYLSLAANQNDTVAQYNLGFIYLEGIYISRDINKSIHYLSLAANQNLPIAQYYLGAIYYEDKYISRDINKAIHYLTLAANQNDPRAQFFLGMIYYEEKYIFRDINKSIHYLTLAAYQNDSNAQCFLGMIYYEGKYISRDINKSIHYLTLAADQNDSNAQFFLGTIYYEGIYISRDINKSIHYLTLAADQNDSNAQCFLGTIYYEGIYISRDISKSIHYLTLAADQNNPRAKYSLGVIYYTGKYVPRDIGRSIHYYTLAANQNNAYAQFNLGLLYYYGEKIDQNIKKGIYYIMLSSINRNRQANFAHGFLLHEGKYIKRDIEEAVHYYKEASSFNNQYAKNNLGIIYKNGFREVKPRIGSAIVYFEEAIRQKNDRLSMYNLAHIYFYDETVKQDIDKSIDLLIRSSNVFIHSRILLCIVLIKKVGPDLQKIEREILKYTKRTSDLLSKIRIIIIHHSLLDKERYSILYELYQTKDFLYTIKLDYIESSKLYTLDKHKEIPKYPKAKEINKIFYEGFEFDV